MTGKELSAKLAEAQLDTLCSVIRELAHLDGHGYTLQQAIKKLDSFIADIKLNPGYTIIHL